MGTRIVYDKRTLRRKFGAAFAAAIDASSAGGNFLDEVAATCGDDAAPAAGDEPVQVCVAPLQLWAGGFISRVAHEQQAACCLGDKARGSCFQETVACSL